MAKTQKFSEDLLLEAVVKYSEQIKTKIKATELAAWSRDNIPGLEDVRDYHFMRPIKERNIKSGKIIEKQKLCTAKITEINKARCITVSINSNVLLRSSKADAMFELPLSIQKKLVVETRETVDELLSKNGRLSTENEVLKRIEKEQSANIELISAKIKDIEKKQKMLEKQVNYILRITDENGRKQMLAQMGIQDGYIDLNQYKKCIDAEVLEMFDIGKELRRYSAEEKQSVSDSISIDEVMDGIKFDE